MIASEGPVLRDIHLPPEPGLWPLTPAWWVVIALAALLMGWLAWAAWRGWRRHRRRRIARAAVAEALAAPSPQMQLAALSALLRRATLLHDRNAASTGGARWLAFLDDGDAARPFSVGPGRWLADGPYRTDPGPVPMAMVAELVERRLVTLLDAADA